MKKSQKILENIRSFLGHTGFYFTVIVMFFNIMLGIMYPGGEKVFETKMFWFILLFSAILALCDFVMKIKFIESYLAKRSIHFVLATIDFAVVLAYLSGAAQNTKTIIFSVIFFAVLYLIIAAIAAAFHFSAAKKENEKQEYKNIFGGEHK